MEISCCFGRDYYQAGGILVAFVRSTNGNFVQDSVLLAQASGFISVDPKWVKSNYSSSVSFIQTPSIPFDHSISMPYASVQNTHCIFITPREVLSANQISTNGVYLVFSLPGNLIPSYKGLSATVTYSITLTLRSHGGDIKQIKYPFNVVGCGSNAVPYEIKFSNLAVFGATSIPIENPLLPRIVDESDDDNESNQPQIPINGVMYNIRDKDLICSLTLISQGETLHPGSFLTVSLRFGKSAQPCRSIRAYLQLCENRIDGSRVQEKILVEANRSADGAELIYLRLHFPDNMACSFVSPLFKISYQIIIEFYLDGSEGCSSNFSLAESVEKSKPVARSDPSVDKGNDQKGLDPFTWNLPIEIQPFRYPIDITAEINSCLDPATEFVQLFS